VRDASRSTVRDIKGMVAMRKGERCGSLTRSRELMMKFNAKGRGLAP